MWLTIRQDLEHRVAIGEAQDVVEEPGRVLGIAAGMRSTQHGDGAALLEHVADGVGELRGLREGADEDDIHIERQLGLEILEPGVADEVHIVPGLLTPYRNDLRHDTSEVRVHHLGIDRGRGSPGDQVDNADAKPAHECLAW